MIALEPRPFPRSLGRSASGSSDTQPGVKPSRAMQQGRPVRRGAVHTGLPGLRSQAGCRPAGRRPAPAEQARPDGVGRLRPSVRLHDAARSGSERLGRRLEWLDRAIDARDPIVMPIERFPFLDPVRGDARFLALLKKMHLE